MDSFKQNSQEINNAIKCNRRRIDLELQEEKFPHQKHNNFPDPNKKSKFDMNDKYYNAHMKKDSK